VPRILLYFATAFLPVSFTSQSLLDPQFLARLQIKRMALDFFDDVFLLHFPFEAPEGVFQGLTFLESDFCQNCYTSKPITDCTFAGPPIKFRLIPAKVLISYGLDSKQAHKIFGTPSKLQPALLTGTANSRLC
jgi:hypothetical protein